MRMQGNDDVEVWEVDCCDPSALENQCTAVVNVWLCDDSLESRLSETSRHCRQRRKCVLDSEPFVSQLNKGSNRESQN